MNTELRKNVQEMIFEVMNLAVEISSDENNGIDVHCMYSGHVNSFEVRVYENGILNQEMSNISETLYLDDYWYDTTFIKLPGIIIILEEIKNTGKIDYSKLVASRNQIFSFC